MNTTPKTTNPEAPAYGAPPAQVEEAAPEAANLGPAARLTGTLLSPGETFEDLNRKPTWLTPMIISVATSLAFSLFFVWWVNPDWAQFARDMVRERLSRPGAPAIPQDQIDAQVSATVFIMKFFPIIAAVGTVVVYLVVSAAFVLGLLLMQAQTTFKKILSVVSWTGAATGLVYTIVLVASLMVRDSESLKRMDVSNPASWIPTNLGILISTDSSGAIKAIAYSVDVFAIWWLILMSIGFAIISGSRRITTGKAAVLVFGLWGLWLAGKAGWASIFG